MKKYWVVNSAGKVMGTMFWALMGVLLGDPHVTGNNYQCRCILCDTGRGKTCHEIKMSWPAYQMCFA